MATKKKSKAVKKTSKKKTRKKTSKKTAKKTARKAGRKVSKKKRVGRPSKVAKKNESNSDNDFFRSSASALAEPEERSSIDSAMYTRSSVSETDSETKSTVSRIAIVAILLVLVIAFAVGQGLGLFGPSSDSTTETEKVQPEMTDASTQDQTAADKAPETTDKPETTTTETTATETSTTETGTAKTYTVKAGDNLWNITNSQMGAGTKANMQKLADANGIKTSTPLKLGQVLKIPAE